MPDVSALAALARKKVPRADSGPPPTKLEAILRHQPTTYAEWRVWICEGIGHIICGRDLEYADDPLVDGHDAPLRVGWEIYCLGCGRTSDDAWQYLTPSASSDSQNSFVLKGGRAGGKTLMVTMVGISLIVWNENFVWLHTASIKEQAQRAWGYVTRVFGQFRKRGSGHAHFRKMAYAAPSNSYLGLTNGSEAQIGTATVDSQNSRHPQLCSYDEVELIPYKIIREARLAGIHLRRQDGIATPPLYIYCSTQKKPNETMFILRTEAEQGQHSFKEWNVLDVIEECPDWRTRKLMSGLRCQDYDLLLCEIDKLERKRRNTQDDETLQALRLKRALLEENCPLVPHCKGVAKRACGHYSIADALQKMRDPAYFHAQLLGDQPEMEGAVYPMFSERENVSELAVYKPGSEVIAAVDFGFSADPTVLGLAVERGPYLDVFAEFEIMHKSSERLPAEFRRMVREVGIKDFKDVAGWSVPCDADELIAHMRDDGFNVFVPRGKKIRKINYGLEQVSRRVYDDGFRSLRINPKCVILIRTMMVYERGTDGLPKRGQYDHHPDMLRYMCVYVAKRSAGDSQIINPGR